MVRRRAPRRLWQATCWVRAGLKAPAMEEEDVLGRGTGRQASAQLTLQHLPRQLGNGL
jgi:hypothetical protein